ncbi:MAG TPA: hypothetical protein VNQ76_22275 [Planctomicrobium sp.]|nr:hypothetical protein [Planctomicrobium sp.]
MNRFVCAVRNQFQTQDFLSAVSGGIAALAVIGAVAPFRALLGSVPASDLGILLTATVCVAFLYGSKNARQVASLLGSLGLVLACLWGMASPFILLALMRRLGNLSLISLESAIVQYAIIIGLAVAALAPVLLACGLAFRFQSDLKRDRNGRDASFWLVSFAVVCALAVTCLLPFMGAMALCGLSLMLGASLVVYERWFNISKSDNVILLPKTVTSGSVWNSPVLAMLTGAVLAVVLSMTSQLIPRSLMSDVALVAGFVFSCGIACRMTRVQSASFPLLWLGLAAWVAVIAAGYPVWTWLCLQMNARVSSLALLVLLRVLFLAALVLPAGILLCRGRAFTTKEQARLPLFLAMGFTVAWGASLSSSQMALLIGCIALGLAAWSLIQNRGHIPAGLWGRTRLAGISLVAVAGLCFVANLDPRTSERILFSSHTLQQARHGIGMTRLGWIDDGRLVASFDTLHERLSLSKYRGSQLVFRQNGLSTGMYSTTSEHAPQSAADILPVLLPLAFHPSPADVLVLGVHPSVLMTCQNYPLRLVRTLDGSTASHQLLHWLEKNDPNWNLSGGAAFQFGRIDPMLALHVDHECRYDVVVSPMVHPATTAAVSQTSREFYQAAARQLNENGIFAQRIPYYDLGPETVRTICNTIRSVFTDVTMVETIPGEMVFLCSTGKLPALDEALVERFKTPQCRKLLGESGWDWSMVFGRGGLNQSSIDQFIGEIAQMNRCGDARWCAGLSMEVSRWGVKANATREQLAEHGDALRSGLPEESISQEVSHRLEDLNLAHQLQLGHPNDPWGYRKAIKDRLQDRPRTALMHVNYEGLKRVLDPEDRQRKEYLTTLGKVAKQPHPSVESIDELTRYEAPFDPLLSLFVHHESIQFMDRCETPDWNMQYRNLLKTIYFANSYDQSVRNVSKALELLCRDDAVSMNSVERWDHANSLMQTLAQRWQLRWQSGKTSKFDAVDTDQSIQAVEKGLKLLAATAGESGLSTSDWNSRQATLDEVLARPLRQKRSQHLWNAPKVTPVSTASKEPGP